MSDPCGDAIYVLNVECEFCGAKMRLELPDAAKIAHESRAWLFEHRRCAKGRDARINMTGQTDETASEHPLYSAVVRGEKREP